MGKWVDIKGPVVAGVSYLHADLRDIARQRPHERLAALSRLGAVRADNALHPSKFEVLLFEAVLTIFCKNQP